MHLWKTLRIDNMLKKFEKMSIAYGLAYFDDDENKALFRKLMDGANNLDEVLFKIFKAHLIKCIKDCSDLYIMPNSKQEQDCERIIRLFTYELAQFDKISILTRYLELFGFSKNLTSFLAHRMTGCVANESDLEQVRGYLTEDRFNSLVEHVNESHRVGKISHQVITEYRARTAR